MSQGRLTLAAFALLANACATTSPAPRVTPPPQTVPASPSGIVHDLHSTREAMVARATAIGAPLADVESAASLPIPQHRTIDSAVGLFSTRLKDSIQESLFRSARYKPMIDRVLAEHHLPRALAYLPVIESAYMPTLTSRAGARGIWQFMPDTAREYGLRVDWWVDERADPERATRAAAVFLKDLYRQFNDWSLVLAAYNSGGGRVRRALNATSTTTFWELLERTALPAETRGYVPTFYATILIVSDPATYGFQLREPVERDDLQRVEIDGPVSLSHVADVAGVGEETLRELNPAFRRGITPPGKATIILPARGASNVEAVAATMKLDDANIAVCSFALRDGDNLHRLALSIGTDLDTLLAMNHLRSADAVRRGDSVYLPVRARELGALLAGEQYYSVLKGDTMYSIARRYELSVEELRDLNQLAGNQKLRTGQKLRVSAPRALSAGGM